MRISIADFARKILAFLGTVSGDRVLRGIEARLPSAARQKDLSGARPIQAESDDRKRGTWRLVLEGQEPEPGEAQRKPPIENQTALAKQWRRGFLDLAGSVFPCRSSAGGRGQCPGWAAGSRKCGRLGECCCGASRIRSSCVHPTIQPTREDCQILTASPSHAKACMPGSPQFSWLSCALPAILGTRPATFP